MASPNVLLIVVDSLRADHVRPSPEEGPVSTPALAALAQEGVFFEQAYAPASWTRSSTASLLTSMLPSSHKADRAASSLSDEAITLAEVLQERGWVTGGMPNSLHVTRSYNFQQGYDWFHYLEPATLFGATESATRLRVYRVLARIRERLEGRSPLVFECYQPAVAVLDRARQFLRAQGAGRWFLHVHMMDPHEPYFEPFPGTRVVRRERDAPPSAAEQEQVRGLYGGEVAAVDQELGLFFRWLVEEGLWDDTLVVLTSDHGEEFGEHGGWWHGETLYDEVLHVPLIVKRQQGWSAGTMVPWQVRLIDVAPTVAAAGGVEVPEDWQGEDLFDASFEAGLLRVARERQRGTPDAPVVQSGDRPVHTEPGVHPEGRVVVAEQARGGNVLSAIRSDGWKYVRADPDGPRGLEPEELFHVSVDDSERTNLAGGAGEMQARLDQQLRDQLNAARGIAVGGGGAALDDASIERMRALGYVD